MTLTVEQLDARGNAILERVWRDLQNVTAEAHAAHPDSHKKSMLFPDGLRYRYWETKRPRRPTVRWCYTSTKNAAGYHLCFRQTVTKKHIKNDEVSAFKRKKDAIESARLRHSQMAQ